MGPLLLAVDCEFPKEIIEKLLSLGCDVNEFDNTGRNALHYACDLENLEVIQFLLEKGTNHSLADQDGLKPFDDCSPDIEKIYTNFIQKSN